MLIVGALRKLRDNPEDAEAKAPYETPLAEDKILRQEYADYLRFPMPRRPNLTWNGISLEELDLYREGTLTGRHGHW